MRQRLQHARSRNPNHCPKAVALGKSGFTFSARKKAAFTLLRTPLLLLETYNLNLTRQTTIV
jgi:hypothetical protein